MFTCYIFPIVKLKTIFLRHSSHDLRFCLRLCMHICGRFFECAPSLSASVQWVFANCVYGQTLKVCVKWKEIFFLFRDRIGIYQKKHLNPFKIIWFIWHIIYAICIIHTNSVSQKKLFGFISKTEEILQNCS